MNKITQNNKRRAFDEPDLWKSNDIGFIITLNCSIILCLQDLCHKNWPMMRDKNEIHKDFI